MPCVYVIRRWFSPDQFEIVKAYELEDTAIREVEFLNNAIDNENEGRAGERYFTEYNSEFYDYEQVTLG